MRVAVALPTLPREALHRQVLDRAIAALVEHGVEVEAFAERHRDRDGDDPFPVFHYLRLTERHRARAFDTGLYLLGRDMRIYEPPYLLMHRFPGAVWVLDPVVHHLMIGGVAAWGRWDEYRDILEAEFGNAVGTNVAQTVASGWGVSSLYRRRDPLLMRAARQPAVCAATPAIARALDAAGASAPVVRVPAPEPAGVPRDATGGQTRILVLRPNYSWPEPSFRGLAAALDDRPAVEVAICAPEVILAAGMRFPSGTESLRERVRWVDPGDWSALANEIDAADVVMHLLDDPTVGETALLERAMANGSVVLTLRCPETDGFPAEATFQIEPGRGQARALEVTLKAILDEADLAGAVGAAAAASMAARPAAGATAGALLPVLERAASAGFVQHDLSPRVWEALRSNVAAKVVPRGAAPALERQVLDRVERAAPWAYRSHGG